MLGFSSLLCAKNFKIEKSNASGKGYLSVIQHLAPHKMSGFNVCPQASAGCSAACLNTAGYGAYPKVQKARMARTLYFANEREAYLKLLFDELTKFVNKCNKKGLKPAVRLNGTSDIKWEEVCKDLFVHFANIQFYDYTKITKRMLRYCDGKLPSNYHLTFSRSEVNHKDCLAVLAAGGNVAVVFHKILPLKRGWSRFPVIDADKTDQRFLDPKNVICGLRAKGRGHKDSTGFVIM